MRGFVWENDVFYDFSFSRVCLCLSSLQQQMDEGRCSALNTYLIEEIDYPFQDTSAYEIEVKPEKLNAYRTSTICRNGSCKFLVVNLSLVDAKSQIACSTGEGRS